MYSSVKIKTKMSVLIQVQFLSRNKGTRTTVLTQQIILVLCVTHLMSRYLCLDSTIRFLEEHYNKTLN